MDRLVVGDRDIGDESGHLRRDHRDVAADIGVVGAFDEAPDGPPIVAVPGDAKPCEQRRAGDTKLLARQSYFEAPADEPRRRAARWTARLDRSPARS